MNFAVIPLYNELTSQKSVIATALDDSGNIALLTDDRPNTTVTSYLWNAGSMTPYTFQRIDPNAKADAPNDWTLWVSFVDPDGSVCGAGGYSNGSGFYFTMNSGDSAPTIEQSAQTIPDDPIAFTNDGTVAGGNCYNENTKHNEDYFISDQYFTSPNTLSSNPDNLPIFQPLLLWDSQLAVGVTQNNEFAMWNGTKLTNLFPFSNIDIQAISPANQTQIFGFQNGGSPYMSTGLGPPTSFTSQMPSVYSKQIRFDENANKFANSRIVMNSNGDLLDFGETILGPDGNGVWTTARFLWKPTVQSQGQQLYLANLPAGLTVEEINNDDWVLGGLNYGPALCIPAQFALQNPNSNDVMKGWDSAQSSSDHTAWTVVGTHTPNQIVTLTLGHNVEKLGLECVVNDQDGYSTNCISLAPVTPQSGNNNLTISGLHPTSFTLQGPPDNQQAICQPAQIVLRVKTTKQVALVLNVMVLPDVVVTTDVFFAYSSTIPQTDISPVYSNYSTVATSLLSSISTYMGAQCHVTFSKFAVALLDVPNGFIPDNSSGDPVGTLPLDENPQGKAITAQKYTGPIINASLEYDQDTNEDIRIFLANSIFKYNSASGQIDPVNGLDAKTFIFVGLTIPPDQAPPGTQLDLVTGHELGHSLTLATQSNPSGTPSFHHDVGPFPVAEFMQDAFGSKQPSTQTGLMNPVDLNPTYWLRHEDWQQANYYATQMLQ